MNPAGSRQNSETLTVAATLLIALAGLLSWPYATLSGEPGLTNPQLAAELDVESCDAPDLLQAPQAAPPYYRAAACCWAPTYHSQGSSNYTAAANGIRAPPVS